MVTRNAVLLRLLGPLEVVIDGRAVHPGGPKQRALLCYLVLHAGEPISVATLVEAVWGEDASGGAVRSLRTYASNLRRLLGPAADLKGERGAYRLDLLSIETDIDEFRAMTGEGGQPGGSPRTQQDARCRSRSLARAVLGRPRPFLVARGVGKPGMGPSAHRHRLG
jgi:DNA-binding SARP family transcriptional activator